MHERTFEDLLERMKKASDRLSGLLKDHQEGFTTWWLMLNDAVKELNEVWNSKK